MHKWCAYCQTFLGEIDPFHDYSMTHGICLECSKAFVTKNEQLVSSALPMKHFFDSIRRDLLVLKNRIPSELLSGAIELGITPMDLLVGVMQPLMCEIAQLQFNGEATIRHEHEFSILIEGLFFEIENREAKEKKELRRRKPAVLLACADGNYHTFGIRLIGEYLLNEGITSKCLFPSSPYEEIFALAADLEVKLVGVSIFTDQELAQALRAWEIYLSSQPSKPHSDLILGGPGVQSLIEMPSKVHIHKGSLIDLKLLFQSLLSQRAA